LKPEKLLKECRYKECVELKVFNTEVVEGFCKECVQEFLERLEVMENLRRV
jgi:hypothetical protein